MTTVTINYTPFPNEIHGSIYGMARERENGSFHVYIDSRLSDAKQDHARRHELAHILLGHFDAEALTPAEIEAEADEMAEKLIY